MNTTSKDPTTILSTESSYGEALTRFKGDLVKLVMGIIEHDKALGAERRNERIFWGYDRNDLDYAKLFFDPEYAKRVAPNITKTSLLTNGNTWDTNRFPGVIIDFIKPDEYPERKVGGWNIVLSMDKLIDKPPELTDISTISIYEIGGVEVNYGQSEITETILIATRLILQKAYEDVVSRFTDVNKRLISQQ